jgi:hypothetical protein
MKGTNRGVQKRILDQNTPEFFMPWGCHNLNLVLCDAAKSSVKSVTLFGVLGKLYSVFVASVNCWKILIDQVKYLTLKRLSDTRWEAKISSVKAVRFLATFIMHLPLLPRKRKDTTPTLLMKLLCLINWKILVFSFIGRLVWCTVPNQRCQ